MEGCFYAGARLTFCKTGATTRLLFTTAALCNNARFADNQYRGDPTETALLKAARETLGDIPAKRVFEIPFDSDRKMMTIGC